MSDLKPYEEELANRLKNLSSPNKAMLWEKIETLLDEDDDKAPDVPPPAAGNNTARLVWFSLLIITGVLSGYFYFKNSNATTKYGKKQTVVNKNYSPVISATIKPENNLQNNKSIPEENKITKEAITNNNIPHNQLQTSIVKSKTKNLIKNSALINNNIAFTKRYIKKKVITIKGKTKSNITNAEISEAIDQTNLNKELPLTDTTKISAQQSKTVADSVAKKDTVAIKPLLKATNDSSIAGNKKNNNSKKKFYLAAGLSVQQLIRLHYDVVYSSDNSYTTSVTDYLPSVYVRLYNEKKWFIQSEFKYAAPQDINDFIYKTNIQKQPFKDIVTSYILKRVYFSQVSAGFHYFILPNLSIGSGLIYNIYSGADIQKDVYQKRYESANDSLLGSVSLTDKEDSNFSSRMKNNFQWLLETQYKWKHFSIGFRYAAGLQPYIKYTDPFTGLLAQKTNNSLNVFIRYELWKSKKFK